MSDLNVVYYTFKDRFKGKLKEQYNIEIPARLYYIDIVEQNYNYREFIKKLNYLISETTLNNINFLQINNLLSSDNLMDRLNGLKKCHEYIIIK